LERREASKDPHFRDGALAFDPLIESQAQFILVAQVFKDTAIGADCRAVKPFLNVLPIDDLVSPLRDDNNAFHFPVSKNRRTVRLYGVLLEHRDLPAVTRFQIALDNLLHSFYGCWLPFHRMILPQLRSFGNCRHAYFDAPAMLTKRPFIGFRVDCRLSGHYSIFGVTSGLPVIQPERHIALRILATS
jgi:hypothetical protein